MKSLSTDVLTLGFGRDSVSPHKILQEQLLSTHCAEVWAPRTRPVTFVFVEAAQTQPVTRVPRHTNLSLFFFPLHPSCLLSLNAIILLLKRNSESVETVPSDKSATHWGPGEGDKLTVNEYWFFFFFFVFSFPSPPLSSCAAAFWPSGFTLTELSEGGLFNGALSIHREFFFPSLRFGCDV